MGVSAQRQVHVERTTLTRLIYQRNRVFTSHIPILLHDVTPVELHTHVRAHSQPPVPHTQTQQRYYLNTNYFVHEQSILDKREKINDNLRDAEAAAVAAAAAAAAAAAKLQKQHAKFQTELFTQEKELCTLQFLLQLLNDAEQEEKMQDITSTL